MTGIFLLLGSNLHDRHQNLIQAKEALMVSDINIVAGSSVYETEPWGKSDQPWFLNVLFEVRTTYSPEALLQKCLEIEKEIGRTRHEKWGERLIDIDILYFGDQEVNSQLLTLPHPEIANRKFTLMPLVELAAFVNHPVLKENHLSLLSSCKDPLEVKKTKLIV